MSSPAGPSRGEPTARESAAAMHAALPAVVRGIIRALELIVPKTFSARLQITFDNGRVDPHSVAVEFRLPKGTPV